MKVRIPYGKGGLDVDIGHPFDILTPENPAIRDPGLILSEAISNPIGRDDYYSFLESSDRLLVIVGDSSRPSATSAVLRHLRDTLASHESVRFLVATGTHRPPTENELKIIFGDVLEDFRLNIFIHDARNDDDVEYLGRSSRGTEVCLNKSVREVGNLLVIGNVKPHYFAGFSGGRKLIMPGVASYRTVEMNHSFAVEDGSRPMALKGNPVHEDMVDSMKFISDLNVFSIQTVLNMNHELFAATAGDLHESHIAAAEIAAKVFGIRCQTPGNIVVSVVPYPMDINLYQSQHAIENGSLALEGGGVLILVSKCREGIGDDAFLRAFDEVSDIDDVKRILESGYKLGYHKVSRMMKMLERHRIFGVTDLDPSIIERVRMEPFDDVSEAIDAAVHFIKSQGREPKIVLLPYGGVTTPQLEDF